jgi:hypothetical protein
MGGSGQLEPRIEWLRVGSDPLKWQRIGCEVTSDGRIPMLFCSLMVSLDAPAGLSAWGISGIDPAITEIDGITTVAADLMEPVLCDHPNSGTELDHVVVMTNSLDRTCGAITEATGAPLKRIRDLGSMRQGFHRIGRGGLIVEVVERPEITEAVASLWGVVINVADLDHAVEMIGSDLIGAAKDAVQPGRRIATLRSEAGLGTAVALMSHP